MGASLASTTVWRWIMFVYVALLVQVATSDIDLPASLSFNCVNNVCLYQEKGGKFGDIAKCADSCVKQDFVSSLDTEPNSDQKQIKIRSSLNGTCDDCGLEASTKWNFPKTFQALDISTKSVKKKDCDLSCEVWLELPQLWTYVDGEDPSCLINEEKVKCTTNQTDNGANITIFSLDQDTIPTLIEAQSEYVFRVNHVNTRGAPGSYEEKTQLQVRFKSKNCMVDAVDNSEDQSFGLALESSEYKLVGLFTDTSMTASSPRISTKTDVTLSFLSGAILEPGAFILLRVREDVEDEFSDMIVDLSDPKLKIGGNGEEKDVDIYVGAANVSFILPVDSDLRIDNGDRVEIKVRNFQNPDTMSSSVTRGYLSAYQGVASAIDNSRINFFDVHLNERGTGALLDIITTIIFGLCFFVSLFIIRRNGLPLTMKTLWTDCVAIAALFSFAAGCGGALVWVIQPSIAYVYWSAAQYFFNCMMVLSLCFHWAAVISYKSLKKLTFKSPVVIFFFAVNAVVIAFLVVIIIVAQRDGNLSCVYIGESSLCRSEDDCEKKLLMEGEVIRQTAYTCDIQWYYLALGSGFILYTLGLMVLGCKVMSRGRLLMINEDPSDQRIRKSLTKFYAIIATTCVLYISAQVIYMTQYLSENARDDLSDIVWYMFIIWLPHGIPPLLLLFLQWNPSSDLQEEEEPPVESVAESSKDDMLNLTPRSSSSSPNLPYSSLMHDHGDNDSALNTDEQSNKLRLIVRLTLPAGFDRSCFVSLEYFSSKQAITADTSLRRLCREASWRSVGSTEPIGNGNDTADVVAGDNASISTYPFVTVLEIPVNGPASSTLLRFMMHASTIGAQEAQENVSESADTNLSSDNGNVSELSYQMTMFHPLLEFVTTTQAVLDAAASSQPLRVYPSDEHTCAILEEAPSMQTELEELLVGNMRNAELSVQTVMMAGEVPLRADDATHRHIGNITRYFLYDSEDGSEGLVVEDLQEFEHVNRVTRQLLELLASERQEQVDKAKEDLHTFNNQKKDRTARGFYGTLIGQIQDEGDTAIAREWLEGRIKKRKEYVSAMRKNIQFLVGRDKNKQYFKASVEKKSEELRFVPINLHVQDLLVGPRNAFLNEDRQRSSRSVSIYDFTTVGAPSAHVYKFTKGGILSYQSKLKKLEENLNTEEIDFSKWPEEVREYDDMVWDLQLRMDVSFSQALDALVCSFVRKVNIALQNYDVVRGEDMLRKISSLGFLFQVESLLSTHGNEIGMMEDMAGAVAHLSCVGFVLQDVRDRPANRFSFRMSRKKEQQDENVGVTKVTVSHNPEREMSRSLPKYIVTLQVLTSEVELPERLANGGQIHVTPLLFTQGINEMQTIANNTERAKTELQDMINLNNIPRLKSYCEKYCRLLTAVPQSQIVGSYKYRQMSSSNSPQRMNKDEIMQEYRLLEESIQDAANSLVKTKRPDILKRSSDLCREMGGGRVTVCKSAKDRTAMSVTLEQVRILSKHHNLPPQRAQATVAVMRSNGVRIENAFKNTGKRQFAFNKLQRSLLPEEYRCPDQVGGTGNVS